MSVFLRLHRWIAEPPARLGMEGTESYGLTHYVCLIGLLCHATWIGMFFVLDEPLLGLANVVSVCLFVLALILVHRGRLTLALVVASFEVIGHACVATSQLGWESEYQLYLALLVFIWVLVAGVSPAQRTAAIVTPVAVYIALYVLLEVTETIVAPSAMPVEVRDVLARVNQVTVIVVAVGAMVYYACAVATATGRVEDEDAGALERLLELGVADAKGSERHRIRSVNFIASTGAGFAAIYTVSFTLLGWSHAATFNALAVVLYGASLLFNIYGWTRMAGVYLLAIGTLHLSLLPLLFLSPFAGIQYWLLVIPVFSVATVKREDWRWMVALTIVSLSALGGVEWSAGRVPSPWRAETGEAVDAVLRAASAVLTGALIMLVAWLVRLDVRKARNKLDDLNDQLATKLDEEQEVSRAKSGFLAQMSHELRTPLNGILGTCEALQEGTYGTLDESQQSAMRQIERSGRHQLSLVNDLLDLSKIEAGGFTPTMEPISLVEICTDTVQLMRARATQAGLRIGLSMDGDVDRIVSDERRVRQMLLNLLGNAVKFTPDGGRVGVDLQAQKGHAVVAVWDTGIGIPEEELPRVFEVFTQLDSTLQRSHAGTGLGLNLTAKLATVLGGRIEVESTPGEGSRFTFYLPLNAEQGVGLGGTVEAAPSPELIQLVTGRLAKAASGEPTPPKVAEAPTPPEVEEAPTPPEVEEALEGLHVLVVDDNPANIGHVRDFLLTKGHRVSVANTGLEAIEKAQVLPDIVFMDVQMPVMDGIEAMGRLRADEKTQGLYIVALTSFAMGEDRARCLEAGADDYRSKPVGLRDLLELVEARRT